MIVALALFYHPFSSYSQKALIALYENATAFTPRSLDQAEPENFKEFAGLWPIRKFPLLLDGGQAVMEATVIIEHLDLHHPSTRRMVPADAKAALEVRFIDRLFDNYVHTPMQAIVGNALRPENERDAYGVTQACARLDTSYAWLEAHMQNREWAAGAGAGEFTLADCAAAPALFYADWVHRIGEQFPNVRAYRARLNARPSFARAIEEARPFRHYFPLGAPDRD